MNSSSLSPSVPSPLRLGINIDHVATLRNARGGIAPDPVRAALLVGEYGADLITAHLREDRRHIRDDDMQRLKTECALPLNMEMAVTDEMIAFALRVRPGAVCLVPERRQELTTEGGLDVRGSDAGLKDGVARLQDAGILVSLFIDPDPAQIEAAVATGAKAIELHTGSYAHATGAAKQGELKRLQEGAAAAAAAGLQVHAGHGLTFENVEAVAAIPAIEELNIGHFLVGEALFMGLGPAVAEMKKRMQRARKSGVL